MKKLMIVAAAAAMIGSVEAANYKFTATLRTTQAREGANAKVVTCNLGKDANGDFWYEDAAAVALFNSVDYGADFDWKTLDSGNKVKTFVNDGDGIWQAVSRTQDSALADVIVALAKKYPYKSMNVYCATTKVKYYSYCYRVAGSRTITKDLTNADCCTAFSFIEKNPVDPNNKAQIAYTPGWATTTPALRAEIDAPLFQRFGHWISTQANKVEIYAPCTANDFRGYLAGQGTVRTLVNVANPVVYNVAGNIVGTLDAPGCPSCCEKAGTPSIAFDCVNPNGGLWKAGAPAQNRTIADWMFPRTAAYGTFRIQYVGE